MPHPDQCVPCRADLHAECWMPEDVLAEHGKAECCCDTLTTTFGDEPSKATLKEKLLEGIKQTTERALKDDSNVKDQESTGRKRAAQMYPVTDGMLCEWAGLKYAGGGANPIIGCDGTRLSAKKGGHGIHHGPDKSTLNNEQGNVHRICPPCHRRWHALNDPYYSPERPPNGEPHIPLSGECRAHDPNTKASAQDLEFSRHYWSMTNKQRELISYRSHDNV